MKMCYVDESGDTGPFDPDERNSQPIFLLCALLLDQGDLESLTREIIQLKQVHFPSYGQGVAHWHDWLKVEVKGANLRRALREGHRDSRRFTWNFSSHGSAYHYLAELPLFGHSENHAMIQLADWVGSAFLAPMATTAYCAAYKGTCVHVAPEFDEIRDRFGQRIKNLQYRFERDGRKLGGIHVLGGKDTRLNTLQIFGDSPVEA